MKKRFTEEDLIRFTYDELNNEEGNQLVDALCQDEELLEQYEQYQETVDELKQLEQNPSDASCDRIMNFVAASNPHDDTLVEPLAKTQNKQKGRQRMNLNKVLMAMLVIFGAATIAGSAYQLYKNQTGYTDAKPVEQTIDPETVPAWEEGDKEIEELRKEIEQLKKQQNVPTQDTNPSIS